ncbi:hypothetical protein J7I93_00720 [Bacillus sp. ISL-47]|uniref:hypothetical protein n=1 Tax=Bacillus sp. ISL-47 TaxID=2819130 RepID=UPI001BEA0FDA|nr:hypothetical protein [Bacillus sp. ISL-47]MBT2686697.1 hypothetical protein [Bacillus sp. ISL-47]MBT2710417.1 hypothetical protein [Pseudomonas sp. ISL-84]
MIVYHGSIRKLEAFTKETVVQNFSNGIDTIGFWFTSDVNAAKPFAIGTETVIEKSETEFWEDGEPKVVQYDRPVRGFIYKVYMDDPILKEFESYDLFMQERDKYCDYLGSKKRKPTWKDKAILLNKEEANAKFRKNLMSQDFEGISVRNTKLHGVATDLYCLFSQEPIQIADIIPIDE